MASNIVKLPERLSDFKNVFPGLTLERILKDSQQKFSPNQSLVQKYSGGALLAGRPLDSTMIFVGGISGAGMSSTINVLFNDPIIPIICPTSPSSSASCDVVMVQKSLKVSGDELPIVGNLRFVDIPGMFGTERSKRDYYNLASLRNFVNNSVAFAERYKSQTDDQIPEIPLPNVVLYAVAATDNRMSGPDSFFRQSLQVLKDAARLIDVKRPNLIVVLTHAMFLPRNKAKFIEKLAEKTAEIRQMVFEVVGIKNVDVVPVENEPGDYDLEKEGDFYKLPDGQLSHSNLFEAMLRRFEDNKDLLARSHVGWYFKSDCPERKNPAEIFPSSGEVTNEDLAFGRLNLASLDVDTSGTEPNKITWLPEDDGQMASHAVLGGLVDGTRLYVIRADHEGGVVPGKYDLSLRQAYIPFGNEEVAIQSYEVLTVPRYTTEWKPYWDGRIHPDAIVGGRDPESGETYYIGRTFHQGSVICGKIQPSRGRCFICHDGAEYSHKTYEILVKTEFGKSLNI